MSKGKKNAKLPSAGGGGWDEALVKDEVADTNWDFYLLIVVSEHPFADDHVQVLKHAIETGLRKKFTVFDKETLLQKAGEDLKTVASAGRGGGGGKSKLGSAMQDRPMYAEVCEHVVNAIGSGEGVPVSLLARFVKYCLIKRKKADFSTEALKKEVVAQSTDTKSAKKGAGGAVKSAKKGKATPAIEEDTFPLPVKPPTTMKKRGEEVDNVKYIDDEPEDGPQSYIILTGFTEAELIQELFSVNTKVHCVVRFQSEKSSKEMSEEEVSKIRTQSACLLDFWSLLREICLSDKALKNVALVDIMASRTVVPTGSDEKELYGTELFNILAGKIYELLTLQTQYKHYMNFLNILNVPFITNLQASNVSSDKAQDVDNKERNVSHPPSAAEPSISRDLRHYNQLMSCVPEESTDIGLILYCLVEQVALNVHVQSPTSSKSSEEGGNAKLQQKLNNLIGELALTSTDKQELLTSCSSSTNATHSIKSQPVLCSWNLLQQKLCHLKSANQFDMHGSSNHTLESMWLKRLLRTIRQQVRKYSSDNASINALDNFCITEDVTQSLLQYALTSLTHEYLDTQNASFAPKYSMQLQNVLLDHPLSLKLKDNSINTEVLRPSVFAPVEFCVQEHLDESAAVQQLHALQLTTHPYLECFHHKHLKSGMIVAHTGYDGKPVHQYDWLAQSHFPLGFQDYIQYVAKTFGDDVDKAAALEAERIAAAHDIDIQQNETQESTQHELPPESAKMAATPSGKKSKAEASVASSKDLSCTEPSGVDQKTVKALFNAYDLGGAPILCKGLVRTAFTADGSQIRTETLEFISKPVTLSTTVLDGASTISTYLVRGKKEKAQKVNKNTEQIPQDDASKAEPIPPPPPALLSTIPQPIDQIICCGLQASFKDSVTVSLSHFGPEGNGEFPLKPELPKVLREANSAISSRPQSQATPPPPQKLSKKQLEQQQQMIEDQKRLEEQRKRAQIEYADKWNSLAMQCKYQQLFASNSYGLHIHCQVFSDPTSDPTCIDRDGSYIVVRQTYHCKGSGTQDCEQILLQSAYQEHHRCYLPNGSIICFKDQSIVIKNADGSSLRTANVHEHEQYAKLSSSQARMKSTQAQEVSDRMKSATSAISFASDFTRGDDINLDKSLWIVTTAAGERFFWMDSSSTAVKIEDVRTTETADGRLPVDTSNDTTTNTSVLKLSPIRVCRATDPVTKEEIVTREDDTVILYQPDGSYISEFADGTRITTVLKNGTKPSEIVAECPGYARVHYIFTANLCTITFPDLSTIDCNTDGSYCIRKIDNYSLQIDKNGDASYINMIESVKQKYNISHLGTTDLLQYCDSKGNNFNVNLSGKISVSNEKTSVPVHSNFLPLYCWVPGDAPPFLLLPESTFQQAMSQAKTELDSVMIQDAVPSGCIASSTTLIKPCSSGLLQNYQVPYIRDTLVPANVHGPQLIFSNKRSIPTCKALKYQHFACRVPINKTVRQQVLQGIIKYIQWREKQDVASNSLLPDTKNENEELKNVLALESKWKDEIPTSLFNTEILHEKYKESMLPKPTLKSQSLEFVAPMPQKCKSEQIDDVRKVLRENKHPPYFSLHKLELHNPNDVKIPTVNLHVATPAIQTSSHTATTCSSGKQDSSIQNSNQPGSKLQFKEKISMCQTTAHKTDLVHKGLGLIPDEVNFGTIVDTGIYSQTVTVRNNGIKPARLKVKQPHGPMEIKLIYTPGPIAAGMSRSIIIEMTVSENSIPILDGCKLEISSEAGTLLVPVKANVHLKC